MKGIFIVFEGGEGSGKTTQIRLLGEHLQKMGRKVLVTKEPGGDEGICKQIRALLQDPRFKDEMDHRAELLLFLADRAQHVSRVLMPALQRGEIVLCDRYVASTFAYQYFARNVADFSTIQILNQFGSLGLLPQLTFFLDIDPEVGVGRKALEGLSRIDSEGKRFHTRVRQGFIEFFQRTHWPCIRLDAQKSIDEIQQSIQSEVSRLLTD